MCVSDHLPDAFWRQELGCPAHARGGRRGRLDVCAVLQLYHELVFLPCACRRADEVATVEVSMVRRRTVCVDDDAALQFRAHDRQFGYWSQF